MEFEDAYSGTARCMGSTVGCAADGSLSPIDEDASEHYFRSRLLLGRRRSQEEEQIEYNEVERLSYSGRRRSLTEGVCGVVVVVVAVLPPSHCWLGSCNN